MESLMSKGALYMLKYEGTTVKAGPTAAWSLWSSPSCCLPNIRDLRQSHTKYNLISQELFIEKYVIHYNESLLLGFLNQFVPENWTFVDAWNIFLIYYLYSALSHCLSKHL